MYFRTFKAPEFSFLTPFLKCGSRPFTFIQYQTFHINEAWQAFYSHPLLKMWFMSFYFHWISNLWYKWSLASCFQLKDLNNLDWKWFELSWLSVKWNKFPSLSLISPPALRWTGINKTLPAIGKPVNPDESSYILRLYLTTKRCKKNANVNALMCPQTLFSRKEGG